MRHQLPLSSLQLPPTEVKPLLQLIQAHRTPQAMVRRARIVLAAHAHPDWSSQQLAQLLELKARLVRKWRRRWQETHSLQDAPRSGPPRRFSSQDRAQVTALACSLPRSHGVPLAHWSRAALARSVAATPGLPSLSASTIGRWLAAEQIRPWRYHSWQHIQDPKADLSRARPVLQLYEQATALRCRKASGSSVPMKKPQSRPGRQNRLLVRPSIGIQSTNHRATFAVAHCS